MYLGLLIASLIGFVMAIAVGLVIAVALTEMDRHMYYGSSHLPYTQYRSRLRFSELTPGRPGRRGSGRHLHYHS